MSSRQEHLDELERLNAQVANGGFYQYYYNVVSRMGEPDNLAPMLHVYRLAAVGSAAGYRDYPAFLQIMSEYVHLMKLHLGEDTTGFSEDEMEAHEDYMSDQCELLDCRYDSISESVVDQFQDVATLSAQNAETTYIDPSSLPGRLRIVE